MKILIVLVHSSKNIGDRAILESTVDRFRKILKDPKFVIIANYPEEHYFNQVNYRVKPSPWVFVGKTDNRSNFHQISRFIAGLFWASLSRFFLLFQDHVPSFFPSNWRILFQIYLDADIVIGSGGNQFYSTGKFGWPFPLNAMSIWLAHLFHKPFYTMPQSIGPLKRSWEKKLIYSLYKKNRITYLRDKRSLQLFNNLGLHESVQYAPDLAFQPNGYNPIKAINILKKWGFEENNNNIGMTIIAPMGLALDKKQVNDYYSILAIIIEKMILTFDCDVYIFRQVSGPSELENDGSANKFVANKIKTADNKRVHVINEEFQPILLMALYQQMDLFIASRLHSGVFSLNNCVPTVFIGYLSKTLGVLESLGLETWGIELSKINQEELWSLINRAWKQRNNLQSLLFKLMPQIFLETEKVITSVIEDYEQFLEETT